MNEKISKLSRLSRKIKPLTTQSPHNKQSNRLHFKCHQKEPIPKKYSKFHKIDRIFEKNKYWRCSKQIEKSQSIHKRILKPNQTIKIKNKDETTKEENSSRLH